MDYSKFIELIKGGEKRNIDFKIRCDAFKAKNISHKAELAKDICAMANNGNITSYLIVGVSDDGNIFESVINPNLIDDALQDFCKKSIFPPPKVKLFRKQWKQAKTEHKNKEFVIIQIGPHERQAFRLSQDFIDYSDKVCFRRHEVWIRRGSTLDLATPEEVAKLLRGEPIADAENVLKRNIERRKFSQLSKAEQTNLISPLTVPLLKKCEYSRLPPKEWLKFSRYLDIYQTQPSWKLIGSVLILLLYQKCINELSQFKLQFYVGNFFHINYLCIDAIPTRILTKYKEQIKSVRLIRLFPVISPVPKTRIQKVLTNWRWGGRFSHYYLPKFENVKNTSDTLASSCELLILDKIVSIIDYEEKFLTSIEHIQGVEDTIVPISN